MLAAMIHRYHRPYYEMVAVFYWPVLFFQLWRIDRWSARTGRRAFVEPDRYGRAWVVWWEGMSRYGNVLGLDVQVWSPNEVSDLCPGWLAEALCADPDCPGLDPGSPERFPVGWPEIPGQARDERARVHLEPG